MSDAHGKLWMGTPSSGLVSMDEATETFRAWRADPAGFAQSWSERFDILGGVERSSRQRFGIVGFGRIGQALGRRASACGFEVVAHDPIVAVDAASAIAVDLHELLSTSDVVALCLPLTAESERMIGERALGLMKPGSVLVNTARGALVDEDALADALERGRPGFAALDVFQDEPLPPGHRLFELPNVVLTPHVAFFSRTSLLDLKHRAISLVLDALEQDHYFREALGSQFVQCFLVMKRSEVGRFIRAVTDWELREYANVL